MDLNEELNQALVTRQIEHLYRSRFSTEGPQGATLRISGKSYLSFCSNDYLGLANHQKVVAAFKRACDKYGVGSGASHLVCGHSQEHHALEEELAAFTGRDRALLFSTGYMANLGVVNALLTKRDYVFEDRLNHASLLDAGLMSGARFQRYKHNDMADLGKRFLSCASVGDRAAERVRRLIVVDGVFSMDGDFANLPEICRLAKQHNAVVMVDDAHGFACVGSKGGGVAEHFALSQDELPILMCTLGKAMGTFGAFVAGSEALIETLIQTARTYIYTTALPPAVAAATRASLQVVQEEAWRRSHLNDLIQHFRQGAASLGLDIMASESAIQPLLIGEPAEAIRISDALKSAGILISAIRPPTVPAQTARLRITLSAEHSIEQVEQLLNTLAEVMGPHL